MKVSQVAKAAGVGAGTAQKMIDQMSVAVAGMYLDKNKQSRYNYNDHQCKIVIKKLKQLVKEQKEKTEKLLRGIE